MCASTAIIGKPVGVVKVNRKELSIDDCRFSIGSNQLSAISSQRQPQSFASIGNRQSRIGN
jgi:hypothetical protein